MDEELFDDDDTLSEEERIARLEKYLWALSIRIYICKNSDLYEFWEYLYNKCIEWFQKQLRIPCEHYGFLEARISRLENLRKWVRRRVIREGVSVPAISTNTPLNSFVQEIQSREIGLNKSRTIMLERRLRYL